MLEHLGGILSGIGSIFGGRQKPDYAGAAAGSLRGTVKQAQKLGIHPLAALGHSMSTPIVGDSAGDRIAKAGEAISRASEGAMAKKIAESEIRLNEAQRMQIEAQTETLKMNAAKALIGGPGGPVNTGDPEKTTEDKIYRDVEGVNIINTPDGPVEVNVGPDVDEMLTGWAIRLYAKLKKPYQNFKNFQKEMSDPNSDTYKEAVKYLEERRKRKGEKSKELQQFLKDVISP